MYTSLKQDKTKALPPLPEALADIARQRIRAFFAAAHEQNIPFEPDPGTLEEITRVFGISEFAALNCIRHPHRFAPLFISREIFLPQSEQKCKEEVLACVQDAEDEPALMKNLRILRQKEMTRIAVRDILGLSTLEETMEALSGFADAVLDGALNKLLDFAQTLYGMPADKEGNPLKLVVLAMGKLGAKELNFSSDIDLIFAYPSGGQTLGGKKELTNAAFFAKLGRSLIRVISENTVEGQVFRMDMGLRPFGDNGPLVMSFDAMEEYYQAQGREWERYALIKARACAGDIEAGASLIQRLSPFVFRRYLDFGVYESIREMKAMITREVMRKKKGQNIKLGAGGIREIEFFGQVFQLLRGGVNKNLRKRKILEILHTLAAEGYIPDRVRAELEDAYRFLRKTEHSIQEIHDQQTHDIPSDETDRERLACAAGFEDFCGFREKLVSRMEKVSRHFETLLEPVEENRNEDEDMVRLGKQWRDAPESDKIKDILLRLGYDPPEEVEKRLAELSEDPSVRMMTQEGERNLDRLIPLVIRASAEASPPDMALFRVLELVRRVARRTCYLSLLLENPGALHHLVRLAGASAWILDFISTHPVLLDELLDARTLYAPPDKNALSAEMEKRLERLDPHDLETFIEALCIFRQINTLRVAAADITESLPLMRVSDHLSHIAETVLEGVLAVSREHLAEKHGNPALSLHGKDYAGPGFVIIAYGKLGGLELGYGSDLDLVFLHAAAPGSTDGKKPTDNALFFSRLGQRIIHVLTIHTPAGKLYEIDMRLRPSGGSGVLVSHMDAFLDYQKTRSRIWEKQALIRARPVAGDRRLFAGFREVRKQVLAEKRDKNELASAVSEMRGKLYREYGGKDPDRFHLKHDSGGMVDIEFLVQYLVLANASEHPELLEWTDNVRLFSSLAKAGIIDDVTAYLLRKAYLVYRSQAHRQSLQHLPATVDPEQFAFLRKQIHDIWKRFFPE